MKFLPIFQNHIHVSRDIKDNLMYAVYEVPVHSAYMAYTVVSPVITSIMAKKSVTANISVKQLM